MVEVSNTGPEGCPLMNPVSLGQVILATSSWRIRGEHAMKNRMFKNVIGKMKA